MKHYVFITKDKEYVCIDNASGGYPYLSKRWQDVEVWNNKEEAYEYYIHFMKIYIAAANYAGDNELEEHEQVTVKDAKFTISNCRWILKEINITLI